jgi:hypothetical protein
VQPADDGREPVQVELVAAQAKFDGTTPERSAAAEQDRPAPAAQQCPARIGVVAGQFQDAGSGQGDDPAPAHPVAEGEGIRASDDQAGVGGDADVAAPKGARSSQLDAAAQN